MSFYCDINYKFPNSKNELNIETDLLDNDILYLQGHNGSGKTTLFNIINGFLTPNSGIIKLNNRVLFDSANKINVLTQKRQIARVFQQPLLFPNMNVDKNLRFANKNSQYLDYLIGALDLKDLLKKRVSELSGGQQQKVVITQSLISNPQMILLDEAFSNLDINTTNIIKGIIADINIPVIITTHNAKDTENFITKTIILENNLV